MIPLAPHGRARLDKLKPGQEPFKQFTAVLHISDGSGIIAYGALIQ